MSLNRTTIPANEFVEDLRRKHAPSRTIADHLAILNFTKPRPDYQVVYRENAIVGISVPEQQQQSASSAAQLAAHSNFNLDETFLETELPVRIWGMDAFGATFNEHARTFSISRHGAWISGLPRLLALDEIVGLAHGTAKGRFRIVWVGALGTPQSGQAVVRSLDIDLKFWDVDFSNIRAKFTERRHSPRYRCEGTIAIWRPGIDFPINASIADISLGGCYVEIVTPLPKGTNVKILINLPGLLLRSLATVCTSHPAVGMGLRFDNMDDTSRENLRRLLMTYAGREK